jgi:pyruvate dehydrogenase E2 component (dihydrolipoamide acetyltransferase)
MATNVILPALGMAQDTGKIVEWLKAEGQHVTAGESLVVIETDKAAVDLEAPATGILARVAAKAGDEVPVAHIIAVILSPEEAANGAGLPENAPAPATASSAPELAQVSSASMSGAPGPSPSPTHRANGRRLASPKARRIAEELGVDLVSLNGSGPGGVVLAADVLAAERSGPAVAVAPALAPTPAPVPPVAPPAPVPAPAATGEPALSTIWRLMAERTTQSWTTIPHFFLVREVTAEALIAWRERAAREGTEKVTYTDLLVKLVATALRRHPRLNASWQDGTIVSNDEVNVGLAVAVADGLVVPVIHQADDLSLSGIARRRADLVSRAQAGKLRPRDLQDGTFTISNLGMYGVDAFNAIINAPQAAILAIGRVADRVVPVNGQPAVRPMMTLSLSCDHRVVDGARGAEFLSTVATLIEAPQALRD